MSVFVAGPVARRKKDQLKFLVMWTWDVLPNGKLSPYPKLKVAGGMEDPAVDTSQEEVFRRELREETGLIIRPNTPIEHLTSVNGDNDHVKHFKLAWRRDCDGSLRRKNLRDGNTVLGPPFFETREFLEINLSGDHRTILPKLPK